MTFRPSFPVTRGGLFSSIAETNSFELQGKRLLTTCLRDLRLVLLVDLHLLVMKSTVTTPFVEDRVQLPDPHRGHPVGGDERRPLAAEPEEDRREVLVLAHDAPDPSVDRPRLLAEEPPRGVDVVDRRVLDDPHVRYVVSPPVLPVVLEEYRPPEPPRPSLSSSAPRSPG